MGIKVLPLLIITAVCGLLTGTVLQYLSLPIVSYSARTNQCVSVTSYDNKAIYSCESLPRKYISEWVE